MEPIVRVDPKNDLSVYQEQARVYIQSAKAPATLRSYRSNWQSFTDWCEDHHLVSLPATPETVALYLAALAQSFNQFGELLSVATLEQRLKAISQIHQAASHESPTRSMQVRLVMQGIRRSKGTAQQGKAPTVVDEVRQMVTASRDKNSNSLSGFRDRALLLVGFATAMRRSELVALNVEDLEWATQGVVVLIRRSKTDQIGEGRKVAVPFGTNPDTCPVRALKAWLNAAVIASGAIFRQVTQHGGLLGRLTDQSVALIVKRYAELAGLDPKRYAGHSLRAGCVTSAVRAGAPEHLIMRQTGHTSVVTLRRYIREADLFGNN